MDLLKGPARPYSNLFFIILLVTAVGCGRGTYEDQFEKTLNIQKKAQPFVATESEARPIPGSSATIRLPRPLPEKSWSLLADDDAKKARMGFLSDVPELAVYETWGRYDGTSGRGDMNMFCYLGSVPLGGADAKFKSLAELEEAILEKAEKGGGSQPALEVERKSTEEVICPPRPDGSQGTLPWRRIMMKGKSIFDRKPEGQGIVNPGAESALLDLWLYESSADPKQAVVVLWRAPVEFVARTKRSANEPERDPVYDIMGQLAPLSAGTLK